jgi:hypothetical protein
MTLSIRFSNDADTWTTWSTPAEIIDGGTITLPSEPYSYMQYIARLRGNGQFESPTLAGISVNYLKPSRDMIFFQPIPIDAAFDEYVSEALVSARSEIPDFASVRYGIAHYNTTLSSDYGGKVQPWFEANRRGLILTRFNEPTLTTDHRIFSAIDGPWPAGAKVDVYVIEPGKTEGTLAYAGSYAVNPVKGSVTFLSPVEKDSKVILDVTPTPLFRLACRITNHSLEPVSIGECSVMFNKTKRVQRLVNGTISRHPIGYDVDESSSSSSSESSSSSSKSKV